MILGFFQVFNEVDWVGYQIDQSLKLCDKLLITEGSQFVAYPYIPERSDDGTLDIIHDKIKEYPDRIVLNNTIRDNKNYRKNQCANFNRALEFCKVGDYFVPIDADEVHFDSSIELLRSLLTKNKFDVIKFYGIEFAFSFDWQLIINDKPEKRGFIYKKTPTMYFVPTHKHKNTGPKFYEIKDSYLFNHYKWVKPTDRMRIRHETSNFVRGMLKWFDAEWENIKLIDGAKYNYYLGHFRLKKYFGQHPEILRTHPWRSIKDTRLL